MRYAIFALLAAAALVSPASVGAARCAEPDAAAKARAAAAAALALKEMYDAPAPAVPVAKAPVCPCSKDGLCPCTPGRECGCITRNQYRWVRTSKANQVALYKGSTQWGNWWSEAGEFKLLFESDGELRWIRSECPVAPPGPAVFDRPTEGPIGHQHGQVSLPPVRVTYPVYAPTFGYGGGFRGGSCGPSG